MRDDLDIFQEIAVVGVEHGAVIDRKRQVGRTTTPRRQIQLQRTDPSCLIEGHIIVGFEIVALAGQHHVVVAIGAELGRPIGLSSDKRTGGGKQRGLGFLAAESAAHAPNFDGNISAAAAKQVRHEVLNLRRMLGRTQDMHCALLARRRHGDLAFEVKVLLAAHLNRALKTIWRAHKRSHIPASHDLSRFQGGIGRACSGNGQDGWQRFVLDLAKPCRHARRLDRCGGNQKQRLARKDGLVLRQQQIVVKDRRDIVVTRDICCGEDRDHTRRGANGLKVHTENIGVGMRTPAKRQMQHIAGLSDIVGVES